MSTPMPMGGPPPGLAQLPPMAPGAGMPPIGGGDPVSQLATQVGQLQQQQQANDAAATGASMVLAQLLANQASPEAVAAQASPSPGLPQTGAISGS